MTGHFSSKLSVLRPKKCPVAKRPKHALWKSQYIQKEIKFALDVADEQPEGTIFLIPTKLEECDVPERLSQWQWGNL